MADVAESVLAIPDKRAAKLARITMRQLRYWERIGLVIPSVKREISARNVVRLYSFADLLGLLVAAELRNRISLQHIRRVVVYLHDRGFTEPLRELRFATHGKDVYFQYPDGSWSGDPVPDQVVFHQVITLDVLGAKIDALSMRDPGTRILVGSVQRYLQAGYDTQAIIDEYPSLTPEDIEAARQFAAA